MNLPYRYALMDSWWYFKGPHGGVANWTARPDIFPNGFEYVFEQTEWWIQAHNRWWSPSMFSFLYNPRDYVKVCFLYFRNSLRKMQWRKMGFYL